MCKILEIPRSSYYKWKNRVIPQKEQQDLQTQLEGTENRIATERRKYNESARQFNTMIKMFPRNMVAGMFGFAPSSYFEAEEGAQQAPQVSFE